MDLQAACRAASEEAAKIDARTKAKLVKRARRQGMTEAEAIQIAEAWEACGDDYEAHSKHNRHIKKLTV